MSTEKIYRIVWKTTGFIEGHTYKESELAIENKDEVLGPDRDYVEVVPGTLFHTLYIDQSNVNHATDIDILNVDLVSTTYNWETGELNVVYFPDRNWDDIRATRNEMLKASDAFFNVDTPDPLKTEWIEYRQLLRDIVTRETAAGRTPSTVKWNDYVPPFPPSARIGVPDEEKPTCPWYKGDNTFPPQAIVGSPECIAAAEEAARIKAAASNT